MFIIESEILIVPLILHFGFCICKSAFFTKDKTLTRLPVDMAFIAYFYAVIGLLYFPLEFGSQSTFTPSLRFNFIPFVGTIKSLSDSLQMGILAETALPVIGNFLMFVPLPIYLAIRNPQMIRRNTIISFSVSLSAEVVQYFLVLIGMIYRVIDIDDLIFNFLGMCVAWLLIRRRYRKSSRNNAVGDSC